MFAKKELIVKESFWIWLAGPFDIPPDFTQKINVGKKSSDSASDILQPYGQNIEGKKIFFTQVSFVSGEKLIATVSRKHHFDSRFLGDAQAKVSRDRGAVSKRLIERRCKQGQDNQGIISANKILVGLGVEVSGRRSGVTNLIVSFFVKTH